MLVQLPLMAEPTTLLVVDIAAFLGRLVGMWRDGRARRRRTEA